MKRQTVMRNLTLTAIVAGVVILLAPIFWPPHPVYPEAMLFVPYAVLFAAMLVMRSQEQATALFVTSLVVAGGGSLAYLDALRFNLLLSYQTLAVTTSFLPWFQLALCFPLIVRLFRRSERVKPGPHLG